ncbi:acyl-CoA thioesterase [Pseudarthrobacter sp. J1738]|uniref:acyl-CoA thioesterase n=1 Tax=Pseudarthrobacter sp. J1738 TaxID=3420446 RepID=UPI003D275615
MHLLLRTILMLFRSARSSALSIWGTSSLPMKVLPTDVDIAVHVNNGMYFSLMDLGRFDLMVRAGVWKAMRKRGWTPVVASQTISYRKSLQLWQRFTIESKIIGLDEKAIYFEQRVVADGEIYARAYIATRLVSKKGPVTNEEILALPEVDSVPNDLALPEWLHEWRENIALPGARKPAPHQW